MDVNKLSFHELVEIVKNLPEYNVYMILSERKEFDKKRHDFILNQWIIKQDASEEVKHPFNF